MRIGGTRLIAVLLALMSVAVCFGLVSGSSQAGTADAAPARYSIAVFMTSPADRCFDTGVVKAIEHFVKLRVAQLNRRPEFRDRKLRVDFYNDNDDPQQAIANVRKAINDASTLAMIGQSGSNRSKAVFEALGKEIGERNIPFLTDMSVTSVFEPYGNVFTMRPSQENERLPVIGKFLQDGKYQRPAYVGMSKNLASFELAKGLTDMKDAAPIVAVHELTVKDEKLEGTEIAAAIQNLKAKDADLLMIMMGAAPIEQFLGELAASGWRAPVFLLTDNDKVLVSPAAAAFGANLYQLAWQTLPDIYNNRLREQMLRSANGPWIFEDSKNASAAGWGSGTCKAPANATPLGQFDSVNLRAIGRGTRFADMAGLIGEIAKFSSPGAALTDLRGLIVNGLKTTYASGKGAFRGQFDNWSFNPLSRTASQTPAILVRPRNSAHVRLAPQQYVRLRSDTLRPIQTLYMDLDLTRIFRIDDNEKSFFAEFFLTLNKGEKFDIANIEFANAFLDAEGGGQKITINSLHDGGPSGVYPEGIQIYKGTGKFMLKPDFSRYPFDTQLFSIELKPKNGDSAFIIQPPPERLRDIAADTDGWQMQDQYVGFDEDYIPITDARTDEKSIVPFYKVDFSWIMKRQSTDYYLRVVVPLAFILIVAFLSIFIPREHFEAVVTIQVTALLSAVALYFSIPKVGTDSATVSDRIFLFDYMAVSLMIAISIMRVNPWLRRFPGFETALKLAHIAGIPLLVLAMAFYIVDRTVDPRAASWQAAWSSDGTTARDDRAKAKP